MSGIRSSAAAESTQGKWKMALTTRPPSAIHDMYAQIELCAASAFSAELHVIVANARFLRPSHGMMTAAAIKKPIPRYEGSARRLGLSSDAIELMRTKA